MARWNTVVNPQNANTVIQAMSYDDAKRLFTSTSSWRSFVPGGLILTKHNWMPLELPLKNFKEFYANNKVISVTNNESGKMMAFAIVVSYATAKVRCLTTVYLHGTNDPDVLHKIFLFVLREASQLCCHQEKFSVNLMFPFNVDLVSFSRQLGVDASQEPFMEECAISETIGV